MNWEEIKAKLQTANSSVDWDRLVEEGLLERTAQKKRFKVLCDRKALPEEASRRGHAIETINGELFITFR